MSEPKRPDPRQWQEALRWLARVDEDLRAADALLAVVPPLLKPAAFHCQQAAEKMLKGALIAMREAPPKAHDIETLGLRLRPYQPHLAEGFLDLRGLSLWYVAARYPDAEGQTEATASELRGVLERLARLREQVLSMNRG